MKEGLTSPTPEERFLSLPCPDAGSGVHQWVCKMCVRHLNDYGEILLRELLDAESARCGRTIDEHEIVDALAFARKIRGGARGSVPMGTFTGSRAYTYPAVPDFSPDAARARAKSLKKKITRKWLKDHSPVSTSVSPDEALRAIFPEPEKVVLFTRPKSQGFLWPNLQVSAMQGYPLGLWFLSNPVDGLWHRNKAKRQSMRSEENLLAFRHGVIESDHWKEEEEIWLALLVQMVLPIIMITHSGDRGAHALVRLAAKDKAEWTHFKKRRLEPLVALGACEPTMTAVRLTRVPNVFRAETGQTQELLYLNPNAKEGQMIYAK
jgi:hypothetical protein